jgi:membrane protease YdiL (CAAX protease family)
MMRIIIKRYPVLFYFLFAYIISWGGILLSLGTRGFSFYRGESVLSGAFTTQILLAWVFMMAGPVLASVILSTMMDGRQGLKILLSSLGRWNVHWKWWLISLLLFPVILYSMFFLFSLSERQFYPSFMIGFGIMVGLTGGLLEEIGWTGFAFPRLQSKYGFLKAALVLGLVHAFWHLLADAWGSMSFYKDLYVLHFFLWILALVALRVILSWIFNKTSSLLMAVFTHASFTGSQFMSTPANLTAAESIAWYAVFVLGLWIMAIGIIAREKKVLPVVKKSPGPVAGISH